VSAAGGTAEGEPPAPTDEAPAADPAPAEEPPTSSFPRSPQRLAGDAGGGAEAGEIDRVMLAKEFGGLLQADSGGDEASS
jgi:hypothetical protein